MANNQAVPGNPYKLTPGKMIALKSVPQPSTAAQKEMIALQVGRAAAMGQQSDRGMEQTTVKKAPALKPPTVAKAKVGATKTKVPTIKKTNSMPKATAIDARSKLLKEQVTATAKTQKLAVLKVPKPKAPKSIKVKSSSTFTSM